LITVPLMLGTITQEALPRTDNNAYAISFRESNINTVLVHLTREG